MNETQLQELLADMPFDDAEKAEIVAKLQGGTAPLAIMDLIDAKLKLGREKLDTEDPKETAAYQSLIEEYRAEVNGIGKEFDAEATRAGAELKNLEDETSAALEKERMVEIKEDIAATPDPSAAG